jgi:hypothetical protein
LLSENNLLKNPAGQLEKGELFFLTLEVIFFYPLEIKISKSGEEIQSLKKILCKLERILEHSAS